jgi:hypothetical protein
MGRGTARSAVAGLMRRVGALSAKSLASLLPLHHASHGPLPISDGEEYRNGGRCRHRPPLSRGLSSAPRSARFRPRAVSDRRRSPKARPRSRLAGQGPKAPAARRWRFRKGAAGRSIRIRRRPERTVCSRIRPLPCRKKETLARALHPRRRLGRAALPSPSAPGGSRRSGLAGRKGPAVAARSVVPPGFCRGCRAARRPGFHLATALAAASSAALALHDPP